MATLQQSSQNIANLQQSLGKELSQTLSDLQQSLQNIGNSQQALGKELSQTLSDLQQAFAKMPHLPQLDQSFTKKMTDVQQSLTNAQKALTIHGDDAFKLYDTYGFPLDVTKEIAAENGLKVDLEGFEREMDKQRVKARSANKFKLDDKTATKLYTKENLPEVGFIGDDCSKLKHRSDILMMTAKGAKTAKLSQGDEGEIVLRETPFYGEMGGQLGDSGEILGPHGRFVVADHPPRQDGGGIHPRRGNRGGQGGRGAPPRHRAQPHGDPPSSGGIAPGARRAHTAVRLARIA
jgi:hypothetical protein